MATDPLVLITLALLFMVGFLIFADRRKLRGETQPFVPQIVTFPGEDERLNGFPYRVHNSLLAPAELNFFYNLRGAVGDRAFIVPKVGLGEVFTVEVEDKVHVRAYRNKIDRKHIHFLLCDPKSLRPVLGIELTDHSQPQEERHAQAAFLDGVFAAAGLPLVRLPAQRVYTVSDIKAQIAPYLPSAMTLVSATTLPLHLLIDHPAAPTAPCCPKCGSDMVLRTTDSGPNEGTQFWGCTNYPSCRGLVPYQN